MARYLLFFTQDGSLASAVGFAAARLQVPATCLRLPE